MAYAGIDYGLGQSNRDPSNGIRYGVISQHSVGQAWYDEAEADYGEPTCPKCGGKVRPVKTRTESSDPPGEWVSFIVDEDLDDYESYRSHSCADRVCESCELVMDSEDVFGEEPIGWSFEDSEYSLTDCLDSDIMILKSPYYTFAQFCSPCVPGAGNLNSPMEDGVKCYCLGHDWFEHRCAPYPVYRVENDELVTAE